MTLWGNTQGPVCHSRVSEAHSQGARLAQPLSAAPTQAALDVGVPFRHDVTEITDPLWMQEFEQNWSIC